ncbi:succinate dehydrogenase assembly factor 2, mitochondrial-like [Oppia nitens]|uniref:succinate dehydrogenase assembly factor 2, mitochondrial-like n=1 Tax=Oppia nitens TaxID=1686743 RepID=UPI0023DA9465|nr:succinate dehydrogenase assembly factor 2, mitochondrial-like [Oppia nitens]
MQFISRRSASFVRQLIDINYRQTRQLSQDKSDNHLNDIYDPLSNEPPIPSSHRQRHESIDMKRKRLLYQSRKRGILENDLILGTFAAKYLKQFSDEELDLYDTIINLPSNDWELYYWSVGKKQVPQEFQNKVMKLLVEFTKNKDKECRLRQPDL